MDPSPSTQRRSSSDVCADSLILMFVRCQEPSQSYKHRLRVDEVVRGARAMDSALAADKITVSEKFYWESTAKNVRKNVGFGFFYKSALVRLGVASASEGSFAVLDQERLPPTWCDRKLLEVAFPMRFVFRRVFPRRQ